LLEKSERGGVRRRRERHAVAGAMPAINNLRAGVLGVPSSTPRRSTPDLDDFSEAIVRATPRP
jgi:hypothetical protein